LKSSLFLILKPKSLAVSFIASRSSVVLAKRGTMPPQIVFLTLLPFAVS